MSYSDVLEAVSRGVAKLTRDRPENPRAYYADDAETIPAVYSLMSSFTINTFGRLCSLCAYITVATNNIGMISVF